MLSCGMFSALAARIALRRRGLPSGSPPPFLAATVISLIRRVNILPRLASSAPFLCLIVAHFEWPDMRNLREQNNLEARNTEESGALNPKKYITPSACLERPQSRRQALGQSPNIRQLRHDCGLSSWPGRAL